MVTGFQALQGVVALKLTASFSALLSSYVISKLEAALQQAPMTGQCLSPHEKCFEARFFTVTRESPSTVAIVLGRDSVMEQAG